MPISGRSGSVAGATTRPGGTVSGFTALCLGESNIVTQLPTLPYPLYYGKISYSESFEGNPTGSITYEQLTLEEMYAVSRAYPDKRRVNFYGVIMEVLGREYTQSIQKPEELQGVAIFTIKFDLQCVNHHPRKEDLERAEKVGYYSYATGSVRSLGGGNVALSNVQIQGFLADKNIRGFSDTADDGNGGAVVGGIAQSVQGSTVAPATGWGFSPTEVVEYSVKTQVPMDGCKNAEFTWEGKDDGEDEDEEKVENQKKNLKFPKPKFIVKPPTTEKTSEGDFEPEKPPENTVSLRDLSSNFDESGDKKVVKEVESMGGNPIRETIKTYGFAYLTSDIYHAATEELYSTEPGRYWRQIEERVTEYNYQPVGGYTINLEFIKKNSTNPYYLAGSTKQEEVRTIVHPDYVGQGNLSLSTGVGNASISVRSNAKYLVEAVTRGWQLNRLKKESFGDSGGENMVDILEEEKNPDPDEEPKDKEYRRAMKEVFAFKKAPFVERHVYLLSSLTAAYRAYSKPEPPFQVEYMEYNASMDPKIRQALQLENTADTELEKRKGKIAVITPDLNYVESLYIKEETTYANSFRWAMDPESVYEEQEEEEPPDPSETVVPKQLKPPPRLMTGQESWNSVARKIKPPDLWEDNTIKVKYYSERVKEYSSQDPDFDNSIERISFREATGDPPTASYMIDQIEMQDTEGTGGGGEPKKEASTAQRRVIYMATTPDTSYLFKDKDDNGSAPNCAGAKSLQEAVKMMKLSLKKGMMSLITSEVKLSSFRPSIRCGQPMSCPGDRHVNCPNGTWIVTEHSWELTFKGFNPDLGVVMVTHDGTSISRGLAANRPLSITTKLDDSEKIDPTANQGSGAGGSDDPILNSETAGGVGDIGKTLMLDQKTRRNF